MTKSKSSGKSPVFAILTFAITMCSIFPMSSVMAKPTEGLRKMDFNSARREAFGRCQKPYAEPIVTKIPMLDPAGPSGFGMTYHEELAVTTKNILDQNDFYISPRPRAAVNSLPMQVYVESSSTGNYQLKTWKDAAPDFSSNVINPAILNSQIPKAGKVLTEVVIGHKSPQGGYPQLFDIRSSAYVRFAGFPPQVTGASLRLAAHKVFGLGANGKTGLKEDFPIVRSVYLTARDTKQAHAYLIVESELFCGALSMRMSPTGKNAEIIVDSHWYTREDFDWKKDPHTALVAYSSMFWKSLEQGSAGAADSAHDSDTLHVKFADGSENRVDLNPSTEALQMQELGNGKASPISWSLANEDRNPEHYAFFKKNLGKTNYDLRASYRVDILASNVATGVSLYQHPADGEYGDNIVAMSTLRQNIVKAKSVEQSIHFKYKTTAYYPAEQDQCEFIRRAIDALPSTGGTVKIPAGVFECKAKIVLKKSNVKIFGTGRATTTLRLANQSPAPVLVIGDDKVIQDKQGNWVTATRVSNIEVSDLTVDGNLANQDHTKECGNGSCDGDVSNIRNNAITIRGASYVTLNRVTAHSAISGGLVTEKYCDHLYVKDFTSYGNYFDGFAGYQTEKSLFENVNLSRNRGAGISIDIDFNNNKFLGGTLASNGDVGIFARFLHNVIFEDLVISRSGSHGAFLAESDHGNTCANDVEFRSVVIEGSNGYGIFLASPCTGNKITGKSVLAGNKSGCTFVNSGTTMSMDATSECRK